MDKYSLGNGWKFPVAVDKKTGRIQMSSNETDIREAILLILKTARGERKMRPLFGSGLNRFVFDIVDTTTLTMIKDAVKEAVSEWEPRVESVVVEANIDSEDQSKIMIQLSYTVSATDTVQNLVYPLYIGG